MHSVTVVKIDPDRCFHKGNIVFEYEQLLCEDCRTPLNGWIPANKVRQMAQALLAAKHV